MRNGFVIIMRITSTSLASLFALTTLGLGGCIEQEEESALTGTSEQEIVGGAVAPITAAPWQVSLQSAAGQHFCGGSIISPTWVVTAAHCVADGAPGRIVAGVAKISASATGQVRLIKRVVSYPGYTDPTVGKDAALIELTTPFELNATTVKAIKPLTSKDAVALSAPGVNATVTGWGATSEGATTLPDDLRTVTVPLLSLASANTSYNRTLTADQLPAGLAAGGKDSCQGDSGGPLVVANGGEMMLAGIVSWGDGCARANLPGLYARVTSFSGWMDGYVGGPPQSVAGTDLTVQPGSTVTLDGTASKDAGFGAIATYSWTQVSGDSVVIAAATSASTSFVAPSGTGTLEFELTVTDEGGATATDRVSVTLSKSASGNGNGTGNGDGGGDGSVDEITGGCSAGGGSAGLGLGLMLALGTLVSRRRR